MAEPLVFLSRENLWLSSDKQGLHTHLVVWERIVGAAFQLLGGPHEVSAEALKPEPPVGLDPDGNRAKIWAARIWAGRPCGTKSLGCSGPGPRGQR